MPSVSTAPSDEIFEPTESFTVITYDNPEDDSRLGFKKQVNKPPNVNVVKPVLRSYKPKLDDITSEYSFHVVGPENDAQEAKKRKRKPPEMPVHSQTILDPHFSRHLDLKLRRLKEKEIIAERISRRSKERIAPKIIAKTASKNLSVSNPNLTQVKPIVYQLELPKTFEKRTSDGNIKALDDKSPDKQSKKGSRSNLGFVGDKPLFITTVKKGEFLPPPASMAALLGLSNCERIGAGVPTLVYSYSSRPKVVGSSVAVKSVVKNIENGKSALAALTSLAVAAAGLPGRATNYGNLMTDRRIVRGSTSNFNGSQTGLDEDDMARGARAAAARRRAIARRRGPGATGIIPGTVARRNEPVQTDLYLEELYDKGREMEIGVQTDLMLERLENPIYVPMKSGCDVETQIIPGDLFDFEIEVEPVLEVLVGKTIEQAIAECLEEEELAHLRRQAAAATEVRAQAAASARHRQRHLLRILSEKEKRPDDEDETNNQLQSEQRLAALALVKAHLPPLLPAVLGSLRDQGYLADANSDVDDTFLPWLMGEVTQEVESMITNREVLMDIVREVIETRAELYRAMGDDEGLEITSSTISTHTSEISQKNEEEVENIEEISEG